MAKNFLLMMMLSVLLAYPLSTASAQAPEDESRAQADHANLATQLQNPIADLTSVPLQSNFDFGIGQEDAFRYTLNLQPVVPITLSRDWNLISWGARLVLTLLFPKSPAGGAGVARREGL